MILNRKGHPKPIPYIDCLTTLPFGPFIYFSKTGFAVMGVNPERGLDFALPLLGYQCTLTFGNSSREAVEGLKENLRKDWVLLGPVDMGYLTYDPFCRRKKGADHYVVAVDFDDDFIRINDPEGFVEVPIPWKDFAKSWEAKAIPYKKGPYTQRLLGEKTRSLPGKVVFRSVLQKVVSTIENRELPDGALSGEDAIRRFADDLLQKGISIFALTFTLPVSNQRCYDSAMFLMQEPFTNNALKKAARTRVEQARLFGKCRLLAAKRDRQGTLQTLNQIADLDALYRRELSQGAKDFRDPD
jgi:hypothetical protein